MAWFHRIAMFFNPSLPQFRAARRTNLALLTAHILDRHSLVVSVLVRTWLAQSLYSHHQRQKQMFCFLSNDHIETMAVQTALPGPICLVARLRGRVPSRTGIGGTLAYSVQATGCMMSVAGMASAPVWLGMLR